MFYLQLEARDADKMMVAGDGHEGQNRDTAQVFNQRSSGLLMARFGA